jgi:GTP-dependent phosphoenolpyruvate carboxykinase
LDCENAFNAMPDECLLNSWNYGEYEEKVRSLLEMDDSSFLDIVKTAKKYYMNFGDEYPHQIIYNAIQDKCTQR